MEKYSVKKPFTVLVAVLIVFLLGFVSVTNLRTDLLPEISTPYLMVVTVYPGASPEKVETEVSEVLESALGTVAGVSSITSTSAENYSIVQLSFAADTDMNSAMVKVSNTLDQNADSLPDICLTPSILELSMDMSSLMTVAVGREGADIYELSSFLEESVIPELERQEGVSSISTTGLISQYIQVQLNEEKIDALNVLLLEQVDTQLALAKEQLDATAASFDEFSSLLLREGVTVKESRGRLSYLTPDRTKPITARKLGDDFDRTAVLSVLEQNAARATEKAAAILEYPRHGNTKAPQTAPKQDGVQRLVDIEQKMAEGKGRGYERWATMHNLKQMAATLNVYQEYGFTSPEQLEAAVDTAYQEMRQTSGELKALETKLQGKKELQQQVLAYAKTKPARDGLKAQKSEKARAAYRQANESDFIIAEAAARYFKAHGITKLPARKALQAEIEQLISEKDGLYNTYHEQKQRFKELQTVKRNIDQILRREEPHRRKEQSHER